MLEKDELETLARDRCAAHAKQAVKVPVEIAVDAQTQEWDPTLLRTVFFQKMSMWRKYGAFDVITDANAAIVGYVDHDKLEGEGGGALSRDELAVLFQSEPLIPRTAAISNTETFQHTTGLQVQRALLSLRWPVAGMLKMEVLINAKRKAIAAVRPVA